MALDVHIIPKNHDAISKFGYNTAISTTSSEDVISVGGDLYLPSAVVLGADIDIVSTSANDTLLGTGARTVRIFGLDANGMQQQEDVQLNGTTDVHPIHSYLRLFRAYVITAGSVEWNVGVISIDNGVAGTLIEMPATFGQTQVAMYTIPADHKKALITGMYINASKGVSAVSVIASLMVRPTGGAWRSARTFEVVGGQQLPFNPLEVFALTDVKVRANEVSTTAVRVTASFDIHLL